MEIKVSAFGNFSTDTGSTDCNQVNINVFRFGGVDRQSRTGLIFLFVSSIVALAIHLLYRYYSYCHMSEGMQIFRHIFCK